MTTASIDTEMLKAGIDLRDLAGRLVVLRRESSTELSGPCPKCGGDDRFHVKADAFFCRQCYPFGNGKPHDAIAFVQWAGLAPDFRGAVAYLGGQPAAPAGPPRAPVHAASRSAMFHSMFSAGPPRAPVHAARPQAWKSAAWQSEARREMEQAAALLVSPAGDPAAEYLLRRGLRPETWEAWGLGYTLAAWDNRLKAARPAILIPWQYREVTALKYRFLTVPAGGLRYTSKAGSEHIAFGLNLAGGHYATLWLVEGELNAVSLWQALREAHMVNFDVLSFGGESKATRLDPALQRWAGRYQQVIVWADEPAKAAAAMAAIPGAFGLRSPVVDGRKLDANELLLLGGLADFARAAWARFDQDPAHVARIRAELEGAGWGGLAPSL